MYLTHFKKIIDKAVSFAVLVILSPLLLLLSVLIKIAIGSPAIFKQQRPGRGGKPFILYKFKTMKDIRDRAGNQLPDGKRLTKLGKFLRTTSLDEIPEFYNVLKGDMSLVGPRPLLMEYIPLYTKEQARRHEVKPGITGWAQVNGRNEISWEEKFKLDAWYIENLSFQLDCKIIRLTLLKVFKQEGITQKGHATIEKFKGKGQKHEKQI